MTITNYPIVFKKDSIEFYIHNIDFATLYFYDYNNEYTEKIFLNLLKSKFPQFNHCRLIHSNNGRNYYEFYIWIIDNEYCKNNSYIPANIRLFS